MNCIDKYNDLYKHPYKHDYNPDIEISLLPFWSSMKPFILLVSAIFLGSLASPATSAGNFGGSFRNWVLGSDAKTSSTDMEFAQLDAITRGCMECHNGEGGASHIALKSADTPMQIVGALSANHPVGMDYNVLAYREPYSYQPGASLDPRILLVDGKVGCVSCHQLRMGEFQKLASVQMDRSRCSASGQLTVGPRETDLCLSCHLQ
ncbi:hypothetical protein [Thiolapillus sp.]